MSTKDDETVRTTRFASPRHRWAMRGEQADRPASWLSDEEVKALVLTGLLSLSCSAGHTRHTEKVQKMAAIAAGTLILIAGLALSARRSLAWDGPYCGAEGTSSMSLMGTPPDRPFCAGVANDTGSFTASVLPTWVTGAVPSRPPEALDGIEAWAQVQLFRAKAEPADAILHLSVVEAAFPQLRDRFAMIRGELRLELGDYENAIREFEVARESLDGRIRGKSRVLRVQAKILADHSDAAAALVSLLQFYPELPDGPTLRFMLAQWNERRSVVQDAVRIYRDLYLTLPGTPLEQKSRARLEALSEEGVVVRAFSPLQEVSRLEVLARRGPHALAREEAARLLERRELPTSLGDRVHLVAARLARIEGRFGDATSHYAAGAHRSGGGDEDRAREVTRLVATAQSVRAAQGTAAEKQIAGLRRGRPWAAVPAPQLLAAIRAGASAGLAAPVTEALRSLQRARHVAPQVLFEAALLASGTAEEGVVAAVLDRAARERGPHAVAARYHEARALERLGRYQAAERSYIAAQAADRGETRWYAMLSELRLRVVREALVCHCDPEAGADTAETAALTAEKVQGQASPTKSGTEGSPELGTLRELLGVPASKTGSGPVVVDANATGAGSSGAADGVAVPAGDAADAVPHDPSEGLPARADRPATQSDREALIGVLASLADRYDAPYPWFGRARDLLRLGLHDEAADELNEAFLAYREARGRPLRRSGLEAVYRGVEAPARPVDPSVRGLRARLDDSAVTALIRVTSALGDEGTAVALSGWTRANDHPRPYEAIVEDVAARHGLDPNLLFAVMRTESVYQKRIVSYAGAIGLMQIMPRTGRHIAYALQQEDYQTDDLLEPAVNLEFAAWYLASLIERFDGRIPLAIASYNGGPHNVRSWMREYGRNMPLDAFLERIPFEQTHRYVRRVLGHYASYRAQQGLPMVRLDTQLPELGPDPVAF